ncbi:MAG TPA: hypothetical protein VN690_03875 [Terriglobales bacterium]|nr:hypothetical protein [Terriglobales bacterium]
MKADAIARARCAAHSEREAAGLCRGCGHAYCRECLTELDAVVWCTRCHAARQQVHGTRRRHWVRAAGQLGLGTAGTTLLYMIWTTLLEVAASVPAQYLQAGPHGH